MRFMHLLVAAQMVSITHSTRSDEFHLTCSHSRHSLYRSLFTDACPRVQAITSVSEISVVCHCAVDGQGAVTYPPLARSLAMGRLCDSELCVKTMTRLISSDTSLGHTVYRVLL